MAQTKQTAADRSAAARKAARTRKAAAAKRKTAAAKRSTARAQEATIEAQKTTAEAVYTTARHAAGAAVDVPLGVVLTVRDRLTETVGGAIQPWTSKDSAERELRSYRVQLGRELNRAERKGTTVRNRTTRKAETTLRQRRRRAETLLRQNRRKAETTLRRNRRKAEQQLRRFEREAGRVQSNVEETLQAQANRAQQLVVRVTEQVQTLA